MLKFISRSIQAPVVATLSIDMCQRRLIRTQNEFLTENLVDIRHFRTSALNLI